MAATNAARPLITAAQLQRFAPACDFMALAPALNAACAEAGIDTPREIRHFLAQSSVETRRLTQFRESLNYSVDGLLATFGRHRISAADALRLGRRPGEGPLPAARQAAIANIVYGGAWGEKHLGNVQPGDGWRFIGRTGIHLTGRAGYARASAWVGEDLAANPALAEAPKIACRVAALWWARNGLNEIVREDPDEDRAIAALEARLVANETDDVTQATRRVTGGANGLPARKAELLRAGFIWPD
jgi:putative chitinase